MQYTKRIIEVLLENKKSCQGVILLDGLYHWYVVNLDNYENGFHFGVRGFKTKSSAKKGLTKHFSRAIRL